MRSAGRNPAPPQARRPRMCGGSGRRQAWPSLRRGSRSPRRPAQGTQRAGSPADAASSTRSTPAEKTGPSPRRTTQCTSCRRRPPARRRRARQQLLVHRVALLWAVQDDVADRTAVLGGDDAHRWLLTMWMTSGGLMTVLRRRRRPRERPQRDRRPPSARGGTRARAPRERSGSRWSGVRSAASAARRAVLGAGRQCSRSSMLLESFTK